MKWIIKKHTLDEVMDSLSLGINRNRLCMPICYSYASNLCCQVIIMEQWEPAFFPLPPTPLTFVEMIRYTIRIQYWKPHLFQFSFGKYTYVLIKSLGWKIAIPRLFQNTTGLAFFLVVLLGWRQNFFKKPWRIQLAKTRTMDIILCFRK